MRVEDAYREAAVPDAPEWRTLPYDIQEKLENYWDRVYQEALYQFQDDVDFTLEELEREEDDADE